MFTVIFVEQEHIDLVREYSLFLQPFMDKDQFTFCRWYPNGESAEEVIPDLESVIGVRKEWRAIILCDREGDGSENPFDRVSCIMPERKIGESRASELTDTESMNRVHEVKKALEKYYKERREVREKTFLEAVKNPLVRLTALLCEEPDSIRSDSIRQEMPDIDVDMSPDNRDDNPVVIPQAELEYYYELQESRWATLKKRELRNGLRGGRKMPWTLPRDIICIARRTSRHMADTLDSAWEKHEEQDYSRFYDRNLYYDKLRYIVYDIKSEHENTYTGEYIAFLTAVLLLAGQDIPSGTLAPYRVYRLSCTMDEERLAHYVGRYLARLEETENVVKGRLSEILDELPEHLKDKDAERLFCRRQSIHVNMEDTELSKLTFSLKPGLVTDRPVSESAKWAEAKANVQEVFRNLEKQPKRAVGRAAGDVRSLNTVNDEKASALNSLQIEDVKEFAAKEEQAAAAAISGIEDDADSIKQLRKNAEERIDRVIEQRISLKKAKYIILTLVISGILCCIPMIAGNAQDRNDMLNSVYITMFVVFSVLVVSAAALLILRNSFQKEIRSYNSSMNLIRSRVESIIRKYEACLSHVCSTMRANSVLQYSDRSAGQKSFRIAVLEKHLSDIRERMALVNELFGSVVKKAPEKGRVSAFSYDFDKASDYLYPMYTGNEGGISIEFLQPGNHIRIPVDFITDISVRREELYE